MFLASNKFRLVELALSHSTNNKLTVFLLCLLTFRNSAILCIALYTLSVTVEGVITCFLLYYTDIRISMQAKMTVVR